MQAGHHIRMDRHSVRWTPHTYGQTVSAGHHTRMDRQCPLDTTHVWTDRVRWTPHTYGQCPLDVVSAGHHMHTPMDSVHWTPYTYGQTVSAGHHTHISHTHTHITYIWTVSAGHHIRMDRHCPLDTTHVWTDIVRWTPHTYGQTLSA